MEFEKPDLGSENKKIIITPENKITDEHDNLIKEIEVSVMHGTERARGMSSVLVKLKPESLETMTGDEKIFYKYGFSIVEDKFVLVGGGIEDEVEEDETMLGQAIAALKKYFANHQTEFEELKQELQKKV